MAMRKRLVVLGLVVATASSLCQDCEVIVGDIRVQALSPTLARIEPKGPMGFEDRPTFMVVDRSFLGVPITSTSHTENGSVITTDFYSISVSTVADPCGTFPMKETDAQGPRRSSQFPDGATVSHSAACCALCDSDVSCTAFVFSHSEESSDQPGVIANCWPLASYSGTESKAHRAFGVKPPKISVVVFAPNGTVLYDSHSAPPSNLLHWPSPLAASGYALEDRPRFFVPEWGPEPMPDVASVDPALRDSNGYDFRNNVSGDTYIFLLGSGLDSWFSSRGEFLRLTGPTPRLPDYAYGIWYTQYNGSSSVGFTEALAKYEVGQWAAGEFPLDVYGLDMNWRNTTNASKKDPNSCRLQTNINPGCEDHYYNHPATEDFPNFIEWFDWLKRNGLHTYFNDHPFPMDLQTSPKEITFRWQGLSEWLSRGLSYFWFDHNWEFTMPPPFTPRTEAYPWQGLTSQVWGSHVYFDTIKRSNALNSVAERPIALTRDGGPNWKPGMGNTLGNGVPAHHRYPVWWTGDGVPLYASLETMIDESVHDFQPFVHSDCGGHQKAIAPDSKNALMRWTAHCSFGTIHRFHQGEHRPWLFDNETQVVVRKYLKARHALAPSIISAGALVQEQGFPPVARCDLLWPEHAESRSNRQYIHLGDTLVAPLDEQETERIVWVPPGDWEDAWNGEISTGPKMVNVSKPFSQIPMWHRRGGLVVTSPSKALRISEQDWSELTLEAYPAKVKTSSSRRLVLQEKENNVKLSSDGVGNVQVHISVPVGSPRRTWRLRLHLQPGQRIATVSLDGRRNLGDALQHIAPAKDCMSVFPFEGKGAAPPCTAGPVAELLIAASVSDHTIHLVLEDSIAFV